MALASPEPNLFELQYGDTQLTYSTGSFAGPPQLSYKGPEGELSFSGEEIESDTGTLATEITVTLDTVPDLHTITFTVLLPSFNMPEEGDSEFDTIAIKTTNRTTIAGPPKGAAQSYEAVTMHGLAKSVDF
jgi:hypothetical protein